MTLGEALEHALGFEPQTVGQLAQQVRAEPERVEHALGLLEGVGRVVRVGSLLWARAFTDEAPRSGELLLQRVLDLVSAHPAGITKRQISAQVENRARVSHATDKAVGRALRRLRDQGLVVARGNTRSRVFFAASSSALGMESGARQLLREGDATSSAPPPASSSAHVRTSISFGEDGVGEGAPDLWSWVREWRGGLSTQARMAISDHDLRRLVCGWSE